MTVEELLGELEPLDHAERVRVMVALGWQEGEERRAIVEELERGGFYERSLALYSCFGSRDTDHILRALRDPSRIIRGLATCLASLFLDYTQALRGLESATPSTRLAFAHKLRRRGRQAVIDGYLGRPTVADAEFCALLPLASEEVVASYMPRFVAGATDESWRRLTRLVPARAFAELERQVTVATAAAQRDGRLLARINHVLPHLVVADPDRALALVAAALRVFLVKSIALDPLIRRRPRETAELVLTLPAFEATAWNHPFFTFLERLRWLTADHIVALFHLNHQMFGWNGAWFVNVAQPERLAVFTALRPRLLRSDILWEPVIGALPASERIREARAIAARPHLELPQRLKYAAYLPWDEARVALDPSLRAPDVTVRQAALVALVRAVTYHRERLGEALAVLRERRNEQDVVRRAMFTALRALPPSVWSADLLPDLEELIRHGLNDVGLSKQTLQEIISLLLKLAPNHTEWACAQVALVLRERGWSAPHATTAQPPVAVEARLAGALAPLLTAWVARGDDAATLEAVERLFVRPGAFALVEELVEVIIRQTRARGDAERGLGLLATRAPGRFARLVPALLEADASWYTLPIIADFLSRRRQDLLTPFLAYQTYGGRWETGRQRALPPLTRPFAGGTARQQQRLADAALAVIADEEQDSHVITNAIRLLALLPAVPAERIAPLASDDRPLVRTTALFTLALLDTDDGLPALLGALDDARARIAIHAMRRFLVDMPTERALDILRTVPLDRVTVAKEVMRLSGELAPDAAYDELLAFERRDDLHRDVRIALLRTLDAYLDRPQTWEILQRAAVSPDQEVALATLTLPTLVNSVQLIERETEATQRNTLRLVAALLARPEPEARAKVFVYCSRLGIADSERIVTPSLFALVRAGIASGRTRASYDEALLALDALIGVCAPGDIIQFAGLTRELLPHRRLLQKAVERLGAAYRRRERGLESVMRGMLVEMARDPLTARLRMTLVMPNLPAFDIIWLFTDLAKKRELRGDDLVWACEQFERPVLRFKTDALVRMEDAWRASRDERLRRLAFAVLRARAHAAGEWNDELMARLRAYRADRSPLVASVAQFFFPRGDIPEEGDLP